MTFGEKLKAIRKEKGYSQEEMAGLLDVSRHEPAIIRLNQEKPTKQGFALIQSYLFKPIMVEIRTALDENRKPTSKKSEMPITDAAILWLLRNAR